MAEFIVFNGKNSYADFKMKILNDVVVPFLRKKIVPIEVDGAEGDLYEDLGGYEDITLPIKLDILDNNIIKNRYRSIKKWLNNVEDNKLIFSTDLGYFYKVKKVEVPSDFKTVISTLGEVTINFICDPFTYNVDGTYEMPLSTSLYNNGYIAKPTYHVIGEGLLNLYVNDKLIKLNVGQEITIDTELELIYRQGQIENQRKTGKWEDLYLNEGKNTFSWNGNFKISIVPNWRCE